MPKVFHGLCTFHLMQNSLKHLGYLYKSGSKSGSISKLVFWDFLIDKYNLHENAWMKKTWEKREQWAHVYMKYLFIARMRSTQLSESLNTALKRYLQADHNIVQFFTHFNRIVVDKWYKEVKAIYNSRQQLSRMKLKKSLILNQVANLYTPPIFDLFHNELDMSLCCGVKQCHELEGEVRYMISLYGADREYIVEGNMEVTELEGDKICQKIHCTCQKFENIGILYGHAIKAL
ncbi:hypothetical protein ACSBR1_017140 [Camellia fascicularis]